MVYPVRRASARRWAVLAAVAGILTAAEPVSARNPIRQSFFNAYPSAVGSRLDDLPSIQGHCGQCHYQFTGAGPRNPFGTRLEQVLPEFPNNDNGRQRALHSIENEDSDGDGFSQLIEITDLADYANTPTFPGLDPTNVSQVSGVDLDDILPYLVPSGADTQLPVVTVLSPNGGEVWTGGTQQAVTWVATDDMGISGVDLFYRDAPSAPWTMIARNLPNSGSAVWFVHNTPTPTARVRVLARDVAGNPGEDASNEDFSILSEPGGIVPTTLRDFHQPGTQPFDAGSFQDHGACSGCHGGYDPAVEPAFTWAGSMMAQAMRDPLFIASLTIAEQDATSSGDLCLRCHTPFGWMSGRSNPTDGSQLNTLDRDGVSCDFCHRLVDPIYKPGISPSQDQAVLSALLEVPSSYSNGQYVVDPELRRRGPFSDPVSPHPFLYSPFHRTSEFCGTCHDVSNPAFDRTGPSDYAPGPLDSGADSIDSQVLFPVERTYSEWAHSSFPSGVYAPEFAGNLPGGVVRTCQDCHLRDVSGRGCNDPAAPLRPDLPLHDMTGGNSWMPGIIDQVFPGEVDPAALQAGSDRAVSLLRKAALLELTVATQADSVRADAVITNRSGHKLPTGYPEGRRMWLQLTAYDGADRPVYVSGAYDPVTGTLSHDDDLSIYEAELGISPGLAQAIGMTAGPSFHFVLNDSVYKDTRIPPLGFTNASFAAFGGTPVDPEHPGQRYADGQNWDARSYALPSETRKVIATLFYQTTSREYVTFLRDENGTDGAGQLMFDLWEGNGKAAPVAMIADTAWIDLSSIGENRPGSRSRLDMSANPFGNTLSLRLRLPAACEVDLEVYDLQGRRVHAREYGRMAGTLPLAWDGRDDQGREVESGIYWIRLRAGEDVFVRRAVRLR